MNRRVATAFIDAVLLMLMVFVLLPHQPDEAAADEARVGDLVVEISWCEDCHTDVDLWVRSPGDAPVGYSRTRGKHFSLLRDDLGLGKDAARGELAATRTLPDGQWVVNVHAYKDTGGNLPVTVEVDIWYRIPGSKVRSPVFSGERELSRVGEEITVARWEMQGGKMLPGSLHMSPVELRTGRASMGGGP